MALRRLLCLLATSLVLVLATGCETDNSGDDQDVATTDPGGGGPDSACDTFCADIVAACPEDDTLETCLTSCDEADKEPDAIALSCASTTTNCEGTHGCWPLLYNAVP